MPGTARRSDDVHADDADESTRRFQFSVKSLMLIVTGFCALLAIGRVIYLHLFVPAEPNLWVLLAVILFLDAAMGSWYGWRMSKDAASPPWPIWATPLLVYLVFIGWFVILGITTGCAEYLISNVAVSSVFVFPLACLSLGFCLLRFE